MLKVDRYGHYGIASIGRIVGELDLFSPGASSSNSKENKRGKQPGTKGAGLETLGAYQVVNCGKSVLV
jgi:hypothetical protein